MKKIIKTCLFAGLAIFFTNCTSDDNNKQPEPIIEKVYHISKIEYNQYDVDETTQATDEQILLFQGTYDFNYNNDFTLVDVNSTGLMYNNGEPFSENLNIDYTLNQNNKLESLIFSKNNIPYNSFLFSYNDDILEYYSLKTPGMPPITHDFEYNENKQFIRSYVDLLEMDVQYTYKDNNISTITFEEESLNVFYDNKKSPFYNLPFDLTSTLIGINFIFPLNYTFNNNITILDDGETEITMDYTYNDANFPITQTAYWGKKENNIVMWKGTYTYKIQEIIK